MRAIKTHISDLPLCDKKPNVERDLWKAITTQKDGLFQVIWQQHRFHEARRWSVMDYINEIDIENLTPLERSYVKNAGFAELTTKPGADRLTRQADDECRRWLSKNPHLASVMQACGTWSRYWNEEESYHETAFLYLSLAANLNAELPQVQSVPSDEDIIEYRKIFPDDNMLRTLTILAVSEALATVQHAEFAAIARDPALSAMVKQISLDESQHMRNFVAFAKALIDSGEFFAKDALSVVHLFMREGGELYGSSRDNIEDRDTHVNWWDAVDDTWKNVASNEVMDHKEKIVFKVVENITGIKVTSLDSLEQTWMEMLVA